MNTGHIKDAIKRYIAGPPTDQAIMLTGDWGSGKTYFVANEIEQLVAEYNLKTVRVSLYGVSTEQQVSDSILEAFLGVEGLSDQAIEKSSNLLGKIAKSIGDITDESSSLAASVASAFASAAKNRISNSIGDNVFFVLTI